MPQSSRLSHSAASMRRLLIRLAEPTPGVFGNGRPGVQRDDCTHLFYDLVDVLRVKGLLPVLFLCHLSLGDIVEHLLDLQNFG